MVVALYNISDVLYFKPSNVDRSQLLLAISAMEPFDFDYSVLQDGTQHAEPLYDPIEIERLYDRLRR